MRNRWTITVILASLLPAGGICAEQQFMRMQEDSEHVATWNRFADRIYELHRKRIAGRALRTTERIGGYGGVVNPLPDYYREVSYYAADSDRLLSRIRWVRDEPDTIHEIEVYIYDDSGRVSRDYVAAYLPRARNAPIQTLINLHHYEDGLHGYRQFDASGNLIYEQCRGRLDGRRVHISLEDYQLGAEQEPAVMHSERYRTCFAGLPRSADKYLDPLNELKQKTAY